MIRSTMAWNISDTWTGNPGSIALQCISLSIIMIGTIVANTVAIVIILRTRSLRKHPHNLLILELNSADLAVALFSMPFVMVSVFDGGKYLQTNFVVCQINGVLAIISTFMIPNLLLFISVERFLAVNLSRRFPQSRRRVYLFMSMSVAMSTFVALLPLIDPVPPYEYNDSTKHCSPQWRKPLFFTCGIILLAIEIPLLLLLYGGIIYRLRRTNLKLQRAKQEQQRATPRATTGESSVVSNSQRDGERGDPMNYSMTSNCYPQDVYSDEDTGAASSFGVEAREITDVNDHGNDPSSTADSQSAAGNQKKKIKRLIKRAKTFSTQTRRWTAQKRVATISAILVSTTIVCWIPYLMVQLGIWGVPPGHWFGVTTMWLAFSSVMVDPIIYTFMDRRARAVLKRYCRTLMKNGLRCRVRAEDH